MRFDPYAPPAVPVAAAPPVRGAVFADGYRLAVEKGTTLPAACVRCGGSAAEHVAHRFSYVPRWIGWVFLLSWCLALPLMFAITKRGTLHVPLCPGHAAEWRLGQRRRLLGLLVLVLAVLAAVGAGFATEPEVGMVVFFGGAFAGLLLLVVAGRAFLRADLVDDRYVYLVGVHPAAVALALHGATGFGPGPVR